MAHTLDADLNVIQSAPLDLVLLNGDLNIIAKLDDEPNDVGGLTSAELKARFDQAGNTIKTYLNESLIPALLAADATELHRTETESRRQTAEADRVGAEEDRRTAETGRVSAEDGRALAEELRTRAEENRVQETEGVVARAALQARMAEEQAAAAAQTARAAETASEAAVRAKETAETARGLAASAADRAEAAADRSQEAVVHGPRVENGSWQVYENGAYRDTGIRAQGKDFAVLGFYRSLEALRAAHPHPAPGEAYGVGAAAPYPIYLWDGVGQRWVNNGTIQGPAGQDGHTPVRGTDYWTDADRQQLVRDTLAALPAWKGGAY